MRTLDFYFDFASPYAYLTSQRIEDLAVKHGVAVRWRPFLLGAAYQHFGSSSPLEHPGKQAYLRIDLPREAAGLGLPFAWPQTWPEAHIAASRTVLWLDADDAALAGRFARAAFRAYWGEGRALRDPAVAIEIAASVGVPAAATAAALGSPEVKKRLFAANDEAFARGVFGSPTIIMREDTDDVMFWGNDRLASLERYLG